MHKKTLLWQIFTLSKLMSGFIEFCVELKSASEGGAAAETGSEAGVSQERAGPEASTRNGRGGRRGMLQRQSSVVCSRIHSLNTISYVDNGEHIQCWGEKESQREISSFRFCLSGKEIKRLKPKRAASFFARQAPAPTYSAVQTESLEQG
ncbi:hypothetical protein XENOCAPTIV_010950 [Xenoophorus captivus]|uniref:Uncharacterized protein n=1 Tax=Xenoophorus captivus TaxID=1517983 RepID=A0ABV0R0Q7_9TELE